MTIRLEEASAKHREAWDTHIDRAVNGTLFHRLAFLAYHGDKFQNLERHLLVKKGDAIVAQLSFLIKEEAGRRTLLSPFGGSYGGFVFQQVPGYRTSQDILEAFTGFLEDENIATARLTQPIACCCSAPIDTFYFSMMERGFVSRERNVSSIMPLDCSEPVERLVGSRARNMARKAQKEGVEILDNAPLDLFWAVLEMTFLKHGAQPTHTYQELCWLKEHLPDDISIKVALFEGAPAAGLALMKVNRHVNSSFYFAQDPDRQHLQGLSLLILRALVASQHEGFKTFDFGTSTAGMTARPNVFFFKEAFCKAGQFRETFEWNVS